VEGAIASHRVFSGRDPDSGAFLILSASQTYTTAKTGAATEANAVLQMSRDADLFPASQSDQLRSDFTCYRRAVVDYE
jgi:hypothetical protein